MTLGPRVSFPTEERSRVRFFGGQPSPAHRKIRLPGGTLSSDAGARGHRTNGRTRVTR